MKKVILNYSDLTKDIGALVLLKTSFGIFIYYAVTVFLNESLFTSADFTYGYSNCSQTYSNILYTKFICWNASLFNIPISLESTSLIIYAGLINIFIASIYYYYLNQYLSRRGQLLFIIFLAFHPYMAVYFFRFYVDIFASLGILLIFIYALKNKSIDLFFLIAAIFCMNFRSALIPVFFIYGSIEAFQNKSTKKIVPIMLLTSCFISYLPSYEFSLAFSQMGEIYQNSIFSNIIYTFGFREYVAINGINALLESKSSGYLQLSISLLLLSAHFIGLAGLIRLSIDKNLSIMICIVYIIVPILVISHMRYLLPLMPLLVFGFTYLFFKKKAF